jgi:dTDP-glucose 4,6-dehydratase
MNILITGGAGFQGSNLARALLDRGDRVTILSTLSDQSRRNIDRFALHDAQIVWGSITDADAVEKTVRDHDLVFHLAANVHVDESIEQPRKYYTTNVLGTYNVVEQCRREQIPLIHVATCEVYGGCDLCDESGGVQCRGQITESCPLKPQSPYAASKAGADLLAFSHAVTYDQRVLILRPGNIFGPGQRSGSRGAVIPIFVRAALRGDPITIHGDGRQARDFVYVQDLVRAYLFLAERFVVADLPPIVNIGTGEDVSVRHIARRAVELTGSSSPIVHTEDRPGQVTTFRLDSHKLISLGFRFEWSFDRGLADYIEWYREHEAHL